jgi:hypothetical protein
MQRELPAFDTECFPERPILSHTVPSTVRAGRTRQLARRKELVHQVNYIHGKRPEASLLNHLKSCMCFVWGGGFRQCALFNHYRQEFIFMLCWLLCLRCEHRLQEKEDGARQYLKRERNLRVKCTLGSSIKRLFKGRVKKTALYVDTAAILHQQSTEVGRRLRHGRRHFAKQVVAKMKYERVTKI